MNLSKWFFIDEQIECADVEVVATAEDPGHLTKGQQRYIQAKEDAQAAREKLQSDAESKRLKSLADAFGAAVDANDRVNQDHNHKLGWLA